MRDTISRRRTHTIAPSWKPIHTPCWEGQNIGRTKRKSEKTIGFTIIFDLRCNLARGPPRASPKGVSAGDEAFTAEGLQFSAEGLQFSAEGLQFSADGVFTGKKWRRTKCRGQRTKCRGQRTKCRSQRTKCRSQRTKCGTTGGEPIKLHQSRTPAEH